MNGIEPVTATKKSVVVTAPSGPPEKSHPVKLTAAQEKQLLRLVGALGRATEAHKAAQQALDQAQAGANDFIVYCAEEGGIVLGEEWTFDQGRMSFVRQEP